MFLRCMLRASGGAAAEHFCVKSVAALCLPLPAFLRTNCLGRCCLPICNMNMLFATHLKSASWSSSSSSVHTSDMPSSHLKPCAQQTVVWVERHKRQPMQNDAPGRHGSIKVKAQSKKRSGLGALQEPASIDTSSESSKLTSAASRVSFASTLLG